MFENPHRRPRTKEEKIRFIANLRANRSNYPLSKSRIDREGKPLPFTKWEYYVVQLLRRRGLKDESLMKDEDTIWLFKCTRDELKLILDQCKLGKGGIGHQSFHKYKNLKEYWEELKRPKAAKIMIPIEFKEKLKEYCKQNDSLISSPEELESCVVGHIHDAIRDWMKHHLKIPGIEGV